jgi:hypothetical protein
MDMKRTSGEHWRLAIFASVAFITFAAFAALAGATRSNGPDSPGAGGNKDHRTAAFVAALDADGFTVQEGTIELTDLLGAVNSYFIDSAGGNNAKQFYKRWVVPAAPGQTGTPPFLFRLNPDEAIVYVGKPPPAGRLLQLLRVSLVQVVSGQLSPDRRLAVPLCGRPSQQRVDKD